MLRLSHDTRLRQALTLYLITDERLDQASILDRVEQALAGGVTAVQLRRKQEDAKNQIELGRQLRLLTRRYQALYIVNDRIDIALITEADGVHLGQDDINCGEARRLIGDSMLIGISCHSLEEAWQAKKDGADYLGVGSVNPTKTKATAIYTPLKEVQRIVQQVQLPTVAIGGIQSAQARSIRQTGVDGIAVVSAIMQADSSYKAAQELLVGTPFIHDFYVADERR